MQAELEGLRIEVEQAEKARKQASAELQAANDKTNELMLIINDHSKEKRQLEMEVNSANAAVEEAINSARSADLAGKKAAQDAAKMAEQVNREVHSYFTLHVVFSFTVHFPVTQTVLFSKDCLRCRETLVWRQRRRSLKLSLSRWRSKFANSNPVLWRAARNMSWNLVRFLLASLAKWNFNGL